MQHSVVAWYGASPDRYVHPSSGARERRLGLRPTSALTAAPSRRTVLRRPDASPLAALRTPGRSLTVAATGHTATGIPRRAAPIRWTTSQRDGRPFRPSVAPAWPA
jgi:hypothetical protein